MSLNLVATWLVLFFEGRPQFSAGLLLTKGRFEQGLGILFEGNSRAVILLTHVYISIHLYIYIHVCIHREKDTKALRYLSAYLYMYVYTS